ncbi:hypothetical protein H4R18_000338 [Coemansia javaensis]|uniref:AAA-ATPase-like domain-containing protein n=1 Tax=Coemansia javaensis TaxID=2761396 RepID=A0A9W8LMB2_9FUNG|nr:hypothetical protein H4R18_000338 [Coemansia javaensis]
MKGLVVDKSLICWALVNAGHKAIRICLPRRFGKTFNLSHPGFVDRHFAKHPVIKINFKAINGNTLGDFYSSLARALHDTATFWVDAHDNPELLNGSERRKYEALYQTYRVVKGMLLDNSSKWADRDNLALELFNDLSAFVTEQHCSNNGGYILLIDEYDQPLKQSLGKEWHAAAKMTYLILLNAMLKDNRALKAGLLVGVNEFTLSDLDSGTNSIASVPLTTGRYGYASVLVEQRNTRVPGIDSLAALFAFTRDELVDTITTWYDGYDFGFEGRRYTPISVLMFLKGLASGAIGSTAIPYWRETGNPHQVEDLARQFPAEMLLLATRLTRDFDAGRHGSVYVAGIQDRGQAGSARRNGLGVCLWATSYREGTPGTWDLDGLVTVLVHLGYLTLGRGASVRIPNRELRDMWETIRIISTFGSADERSAEAIHRDIVDDLYRGDVRGLLAGFRPIMAGLSNAVLQYMEQHQAGYKCLRPRDRARPGALVAEARGGLQQIVDHRNADPFGSFSRRLDVGVGFDRRDVVHGPPDTEHTGSDIARFTAKAPRPSAEPSPTPAPSQEPHKRAWLRSSVIFGHKRDGGLDILDPARQSMATLAS